MDAYIYQSELWCEDCASEIQRMIDMSEEEGSQLVHDSDDCPDGPYPDGGGEADCPQHCAAGEECDNALELSDGRKVGAWLENPLTEEGRDYVRDKLTHNPTEVSRFWGEMYEIDSRFVASSLAVELAETIRNGNRKDAISQIEELEPMQAAAVAFYLRDQLSGDDYNIGVIGRLLELAAYDD